MVPVGVKPVAVAPEGTIHRLLSDPGVLRRFALASVVANVLIVVTGGIVRLTSSGLGCPTWPSCTADSLTPVPQYRWHGAVEFGNRMLTFVLVAVAVATVLLALVQRTERRWAALAFLGIPAQAVLGGITVLTGLNPWWVAAHFLLSMVIIAVTMVLVFRVERAIGVAPPLPTPAPVRRLAGAALAVTAAVLMVGTVVTGSGPHAGDTLHVTRMGFSPAAVSQLHADLVMVLIGLSVGLVVTLHLTGAPRGARRAGWWLLAAIGGQGVIGYTQYFLGVPAGLVAIHVLGACLVWVAALRVVVELHPAPGVDAIPLDDRVVAAAR